MKIYYVSPDLVFPKGIKDIPDGKRRVQVKEPFNIIQWDISESKKSDGSIARSFRQIGQSKKGAFGLMVRVDKEENRIWIEFERADITPNSKTQPLLKQEAGYLSWFEFRTQCLVASLKPVP